MTQAEIDRRVDAAWKFRPILIAQENKRRIAAYYAKPNERYQVRELTDQEFIDLITPNWLKRQAG